MGLYNEYDGKILHNTSREGGGKGKRNILGEESGSERKTQ